MRKIYLAIGVFILASALAFLQFGLYLTPQTTEATNEPATPKEPSNEQVFISLLSSLDTTACFECHDEVATKSFHVPEKIMKIDESRGLRRRICVDCHGLNGNSPTEQMTDPKDITYDPLTGVFKLPVQVPHIVHRNKILSDAMRCQDCHIANPNSFDITFPKVDAADGQVLYCQNCKAASDPHPERGNYIAIHVEKAGKKCNICHVGDVLEIHKQATGKLGVFSR